MASVGETRLEPTQTHATPASSHGRYRVVGPLSKGGMAELLLALQLGVKGFSRVVALKRVLPSHAKDEAFLEMFLDEARLATRLARFLSASDKDYDAQIRFGLTTDTYDITGEDENGKIIGRHRSTGIARPRFWDRARYYGLERELAEALDAAE